MTPGGEIQVQGAIAVEIHQGYVADDPVPHLGEIDLLEREPSAQIRVQEDAERGADGDVGPTVVVIVACGQGAEMHRPGLHALVGTRQRQSLEPQQRSVDPAERLLAALSLRLEWSEPDLGTCGRRNPLRGGLWTDHGPQLRSGESNRQSWAPRWWRGEGGELCGLAGLADVVPVLQHSGGDAGAQPDYEHRGGRNRRHPPRQGGAEQAPGIDAVDAERSEQCRDDRNRHAGVQQHRADDHVESHRDRQKNAEGGRAHQQRGAGEPAVDAPKPRQQIPRQNFGEHGAGHARQQHERQRDERDAPQIAGKMQQYPAESAHGPLWRRRRFAAEIGRPEQRLETLEPSDAGELRRFCRRPRPSRPLREARQPRRDQKHHDHAGEDFQRREVPGKDRQHDAEHDHVEGRRAEQRRQRRLHAASALEHSLRDRRRAVDADAERSADQHALDGAGKLSAARAAQQGKDGEHAGGEEQAEGHALAVRQRPLDGRPADVAQRLVTRRLGEEPLETERSGERLVGVGAGLALQRGVARPDPEHRAKAGDQRASDQDAEIEAAIGGDRSWIERGVGVAHRGPSGA